MSVGLLVGGLAAAPAAHAAPAPTPARMGVPAGVQAAGPGRLADSIRQRLLHAQGLRNHDYFGVSVAVAGSTLVVGAGGHEIGSNPGQGAAYVFARSRGRWSQTAELTAPDGQEYDGFGLSVAVADSTIVVGAPRHEIGSNLGQGAAYVFARSRGRWSQTAELTAADGQEYDRFGSSVAVAGSTLVAGAYSHQVGSHAYQGSAYVFTRSSGGWAQTAEVNATDGQPYDSLGASVAVAGSTLVVGAPNHQVGSSAYQGSAYVFTRSSGGWAQTAALTAADGQEYDMFGSSVAVADSTLVVGAPNHQVGSSAQQGVAYVYTHSRGRWLQAAVLTAADGQEFDSFGSSVAVAGSTIVVGAPAHEVDQGAAYVFAHSRGRWLQTAELIAADGQEDDWFGSSVAVADSTAVVGAPGHAGPGRAYVFLGV